MGQDKPKKEDKDTEAETKLLETGEQTLLEMQDAMSTMMGASTKMMQSFVDMRMSYLKVMRMGLEDPQTSFDVASKNMRDLAKAMKNKPK